MDIGNSAAKNNPMAKDESVSVVRILLAVLLPPVAAAMQVGFKPTFWLNLVLTILGWLPGVAHAMFLVLVQERENKPAVAIPDDMDVQVRRPA